MGLKNLIRNATQIARTAWTADRWPGWMTSATGPGDRLNVAGLDRPAENVLMVYGCLTARREAVGSVALRITDAAGNVVESGPLALLLERPNGQMRWDQYVRTLETYNTIYNAIVIAKVGDGPIPDELVPLSPGYLTPVLGVHAPTGTAVAVEWQYQDPWTGMQRIYRPDELIIHAGFNPHAPLEALSPLKVLRRTMQAELAAREQNLGLFVNDSTPKTVLETSSFITKEQADEVLDKWESNYGGFDKRHKTAVLWGGLKANKLGLSPAEMEFLESLKFARTDYYIVFRISPAMLGEMTGETSLSQGSSTEQQKIQWWEDVGLSELDLIAGLHQQLASAIRGNGLVTKRESNRLEREARGRWIRRAALRRLRGYAGQTSSQLEVWFDDNTIPALARQRLAKLKQLTEICALGWKPDDVAEFLDLGLPPHPDNIGRVPFAATPIGDGPGVAEAAMPGTAVTGREAFSAMDNVERLIREAADPAAKFKKIKRAFEQFLAPREKAAAKKWSRFYLEQRDRILARMRSEGSQRESNRIGRAGQPVPPSGSADDLIKEVFPRSVEDQQLLVRLTPLWTEHLRDGGAFFAQETGVKNPFEVGMSPEMKKAIDGRAIQGLKVNDTTEEALRGIFRAGLEAGATTKELSDQVAAYYADHCIGADKIRPMTAARTQTTGIVNEGRLLAAKEVGGLKKAWLHGGSAEPRESHLAAQTRYLANPIALDDQFEIEGETCDAPGDANLSVDQTANCSCMEIFVPG